VHVGSKRDPTDRKSAGPPDPGARRAQSAARRREWYERAMTPSALATFLPGLVAQLSGFFYALGLNITASNHTDTIDA